MFKRIIVTTDLSADSCAFMESLKNLRSFGAEECLLLQCLTIQETTGIALSYFTSVVENKLLRQKELLEKLGYTVQTRIIFGFARDEVNEIAREENYSLIVVGAKKQSVSSELLFGGIAYSVIRYAKKPILLIRSEEKPNDTDTEVPQSGITEHILFPTDFSENASRAQEYLLEMAAAGVKKITLLHVQDRSQISPHLSDRLEEFNRIDNERLQNIRSLIQEKGGVQVDTVIKYGSPTVEIIKAAKELKPGIIIMGTQGRGFVKELFLGSVSNNVAHMVETSVLLIPSKRDRR